ncbi:MAG TPA: ATP-binding protein, partial [Methanotrichaceae archaeon]|nr:ATP-binding protein [Methanotrichaceae archaeon]
MPEDNATPTDLPLRQRAEEAMKEKGRSGKFSDADVRALCHELEVHQEELKMQNDELLQVQAKLAASEKKYRDLYDFAPIGYLTLDDSGKVLETNLVAASLLGTERKYLVDNRFQAYLAQDCLQGFDAFRRRVIESDAKQTAEFQLMGNEKDGKDPLWILVEAQAASDGVDLGFRMAVIGITEHKRLEGDLRKSKDELAQKVQQRTEELAVTNEELLAELEQRRKLEVALIKTKEAAQAASEAKAAFLANMSHELRTPMNAVLGMTGLLLDEPITPEQKEYVEAIRKGGDALLDLINDILDISRMGKEKIELYHQPFSLRYCIEEALDLVSSQASQKGLNLAYTINYGTPDTIVGDHGRLRQVLVKLLSNAIKFTDAGDVSVSVSSKLLGQNKHHVLFAIKDTGIGIPQDKMDRLFQPFCQVEYNLSLKRDGAGLGLAICKKLVELMGGKIWADSSPGEGAIFRFTIEAEALPGRVLDLGNADKTAFGNLTEQKPLSILVAEDNPSNQKVLVEMLKIMGYRADAVADGYEVIESLERRPYDLIFMDVKMPEMDGLKATQEIRRRWPTYGPKIVAITAQALAEDREKCVEA